MFDILTEAKERNILTEITVNNEQEYIGQITGLSQSLKNQGLNPILIAETFRSPAWINDWESATWRKDILLPAGIEIERKEKRHRGGYIFHINGVPLYDGRALTEGTILLPSEVLKKVKFRQLENGYPVLATFQADPNDPWHGTLNYHWERAVELDANYTIYHIKYPKDIVERD